jgi:hypothetical protein
LPISRTVAGTNTTALIIQTALELLAAIAVTVIVGPARLSRTEPKQVVA